jgi:hypothetical protein
MARANETVKAESTSIARLMGELIEDAQHLIRKELQLARTEVRGEISKAKQGLVSLGVGIAVLLAGGLMLLFMLVYLLADVAELSLWLSYLIVGGVFTLGGVLLLFVAQNRMQQFDPTPYETIESTRKDEKWLKEQMPSGQK